MSVLKRIFDHKRRELEMLTSQRPLSEVKSRALDAPPTRGFAKALRSAPCTALIAEVKKASPISGVIRERFDPVEIATAYEAAGSHCVSVLTDTPFFQGASEHLIAARQAISLPVLRKDFTTDAYHVYEARAMGADAVLLIVYGLTLLQLEEYRELAESLEMDALVETHSEQELSVALDSGASMIGVNNRDLETFETTLEISERLLPRIPASKLAVSESALGSAADVRRVAKAGAKAVLIGTALSASNDVARKAREVMGWSRE